MIGISVVDPGKTIDWGQDSRGYARHRPDTARPFARQGVCQVAANTVHAPRPVSGALKKVQDQWKETYAQPH